MNEEEVSRGLLAIAARTPELRIDVGQAIKAAETRRRRMITATVVTTAAVLVGVVVIVRLPGTPQEPAKPVVQGPWMGASSSAAYIPMPGVPVSPPNIDTKAKMAQLADHLSVRIPQLAPGAQIEDRGSTTAPGWDLVISSMTVQKPGSRPSRLIVRTFGPAAGLVMRQAPPEPCLMASGNIRPDIGSALCAVQPDGSAVQRTGEPAAKQKLPDVFNGNEPDLLADYYTVWRHYRLDGSVVEVWRGDPPRGEQPSLDSGFLEDLAADPAFSFR